MIADKHITENFTLMQLLHSDTATRNHIEEQFNPSNEIVENLTGLAVNILQPLRNKIGKDFFITCAYRCAKVNASVGGAATSQHLTGEAADCVFNDGNAKLAKAVLDAELPFDQMILEGGTLQKPNWVHISYSPKNRRQILRADFTTGKAVYTTLTKEQIHSL
jgi:hypothetical protein